MQREKRFKFILKGIAVLRADHLSECMQSTVFFVIHIPLGTVKIVNNKWFSCNYNCHLNFIVALPQFIDFYLILIRKEPTNYTSKASKS